MAKKRPLPKTRLSRCIVCLEKIDRAATRRRQVCSEACADVARRLRRRGFKAYNCCAPKCEAYVLTVSPTEAACCEEHWSAALAERDRARRNRERRADAGEVKLTVAERREVFLAARGRCYLCGERIAGINLETMRAETDDSRFWLAVGHVVPLERAGRHTEGNWAPAHLGENSAKREKFLVEYPGRRRVSMARRDPATMPWASASSAPARGQLDLAA